MDSILVSPTEKSFYSLEYTQLSDEGDPELGCAEYSSIISELKSHREEIERLQSGFNPGFPPAISVPEASADLPRKEDTGAVRRVPSEIIPQRDWLIFDS